MSDALDYASLGFRCGLEVHQQLATTKLFCRCPTADLELDDEAPDFRFLRRLRPTQSEMGEVDAAALAESRRDRSFEYRGFERCSCLVEADEEPPRPASPEAVDVALTAALLLKSDPVDEIQWMRKIVIDGSNTSGFQRTGLVARGGRVEDVGVQSICLEEDSARRIRDEPDRVIWGLDRLGIPLIEIATDASIRDGAHARRVAARLGAVLRSTGRVKRGLGTIRQDLNVSVRGGTRVEVKGVQELNSIARVIDWEVRRHLRMLEVAKALKDRAVESASFAWAPQDLTDLFRKTEARFVRKAVDGGGVVLGHRLPGLHGLIGAARKEDPRLGRELASYARRDGGIQGLLHGDEVPGLGVTEAEVREVRRRLAVGTDDSFVLVAESAERAGRALRIIVQRAARATEGVLPEVRMAEADHSTSYLRPMPGSARMYPETDIPPNTVTKEHLGRLLANLPPPPEAVVAALRTRHGVGQEEAQQIVAEGLESEFATLAAAGDASLAARVLLAYLPDLERRYPGRGAQVAGRAQEAIAAVGAGRFAKEGIPTVLEAFAKGEANTLEEALAKGGLTGADLRQVEARAHELVVERLDFVRQRGRESVGPLMGLLMKEYRGKVDGGKLNALLLREVDRALETAPTKP